MKKTLIFALSLLLAIGITLTGCGSSFSNVEEALKGEWFATVATMGDAALFSIIFNDGECTVAFSDKEIKGTYDIDEDSINISIESDLVSDKWIKSVEEIKYTFDESSGEVIFGDPEADPYATDYTKFTAFREGEIRDMMDGVIVKDTRYIHPILYYKFTKDSVETYIEDYKKTVYAEMNAYDIVGGNVVFKAFKENKEDEMMEFYYSIDRDAIGDYVLLSDLGTGELNKHCDIVNRIPGVDY